MNLVHYTGVDTQGREKLVNGKIIDTSKALSLSLAMFACTIKHSGTQSCKRLVTSFSPQILYLYDKKLAKKCKERDGVCHLIFISKQRPTQNALA